MPQPDSARAGPGVLIAGLESESADHRAFRRCTRKRAELLAIPAAAAIQNARLYSTAEIYGSELEKRLADLQNAERALDQSEEGRRVSEDKFQKIFHSSPIAFSITTVEEGRFLEVNAGFESRYGYSRPEVPKAHKGWHCRLDDGVSTCGVAMIDSPDPSPGPVARAGCLSRSEGLDRDLQALPQALVHQNFDIYTTV